jgi:hypothetical protein
MYQTSFYQYLLLPKLFHRFIHLVAYIFQVMLNTVFILNCAVTDDEWNILLHWMTVIEYEGPRIIPSTKILEFPSFFA